MSDKNNTQVDEVNNDDNEQVDETQEGEDEGSNTPSEVPYSRLKKEVDRRKGLEGKVEELTKSLQEREAKEALKEFQSELDKFKTDNKKLVKQLLKDGDVDSEEELDDILTKMAHSDKGAEKDLDELFKTRFKRLYRDNKEEPEETNSSNPTGDEKRLPIKGMKHEDKMALTPEQNRERLKKLMRS